MLHEILFAMMGRHGNIVIEMNKAFSINPNIDFLSPTEKSLVGKLVNLGYFYKQILSVIAKDRKAFNSRILDYDNTRAREE